MRYAWCVTVVAAMPLAWASSDEARSWAALGDERAQAGDRAGAVEMYQRAVTADPEDLEAHDRLAKQRIALGALSEVIAQLEPVVRRHPTYAQGIYTLAYCYRKLDRTEDAIASYGAYIRLRPDDPDPHYGYAQALRQAGRTEEALRAFRTYVGMETRPSASAWMERAEAAMRELEGAEKSPPGQPPAGADELERRRTDVRDRPDDPVAWKALAEALRERGLERRAESAQRRVAEVERLIATGGPDARTSMPGEASKGTVRVATVALAADDGHIERLRTALRDDPEDAGSWSLLARALSEAGRHPEARWAERRHQEITGSGSGKEGGGGTEGEGVSGSGTGAGADPAKTAEDTIGSPDDESHQQSLRLMERGNELFRAGRFADAEDAYRAAAEADPNNAEAEYRRGLALLQLGQRNEAKVAFEQALRRDPNHVGARAQLQGLSSPSGPISP